jgi:hypothetical protein
MGVPPSVPGGLPGANRIRTGPYDAAVAPRNGYLVDNRQVEAAERIRRPVRTVRPLDVPAHGGIGHRLGNLDLATSPMISAWGPRPMAR